MQVNECRIVQINTQIVQISGRIRKIMQTGNMLDLLSDILTRLSLTGTLYFRTSFTKPWGVAVPAYENVARFHYVHRGECLIRVDGVAKPYALAQGSLLIVPHGAGHALYCGHDPDNTVLPLDRVLENSGFDGKGVLVHGGAAGGHEAQLICGHFAFDPNARHVLLDRLPPAILIESYGEESGTWMEATLRLIGTEAGGRKMGGDLIALKLSEAIFAQALRSFLDSEGADAAGLAGFADARICRALDAMHGAPDRAWRLQDLAREAGISRTGFAGLFAEKMGMTPMQYLSSWRMELAKQALAQGEGGIAEIAMDVGYASDTAFTRVFKKEVGQTPAGYRRAVQAQVRLS